MTPFSQSLSKSLFELVMLFTSELLHNQVLFLIEVFTKRLVKKWLNIGLLSDIPL